MGSIDVKIVVFSDNLAPGKTQTWFWNNPNINFVYTFSAATHSNGSALGSNLAVQISPLRFSLNNETGKRRIEYDVKNVTQQPLNYEIHMSVSKPT